jgi:hypothetical protein
LQELPITECRRPAAAPTPARGPPYGGRTRMRSPTSSGVRERAVSASGDPPSSSSSSPGGSVPGGETFSVTRSSAQAMNETVNRVSYVTSAGRPIVVEWRSTGRRHAPRRRSGHRHVAARGSLEIDADGLHGEHDGRSGADVRLAADDDGSKKARRPHEVVRALELGVGLFEASLLGISEQVHARRKVESCLLLRRRGWSRGLVGGSGSGRGCDDDAHDDCGDSSNRAQGHW